MPPAGRIDPPGRQRCESSVNSKPTYLSREGESSLRQELDDLVNVRRAEVAARIHDAKQHGDLSENAEYHQAREEQAEVEDRITRLENLLKNAVLAPVGSSEIVTIGSTVRVEKSGDNKSMVFTIVGSEEADMSHGKISNLSPIGSAILGHKTGDTVKVATPKGAVTYTIAALK